MRCLWAAFGPDDPREPLPAGPPDEEVTGEDQSPMAVAPEEVRRYVEPLPLFKGRPGSTSPAATETVEYGGKPRPSEQLETHLNAMRGGARDAVHGIYRSAERMCLRDNSPKSYDYGRHGGPTLHGLEACERFFKLMRNEMNTENSTSETRHFIFSLFQTHPKWKLKFGDAEFEAVNVGAPG